MEDKQIPKTFPIGFWNILGATHGGVDAVQDWADFGTTLTMSGTFHSWESKEEFLKILDRCYEKHIRIVVSDERSWFPNVTNGHYEQDAEDVIRDFGSHPAVIGFHLGDEPNGDQTENAIRAVQIYRRLCPEKEVYLNLLPWYSDEWGGVEARVSITGDYKSYLVDFVRRSGIGLLSYDCYFQMEELHGQPTERAWETYYRNLRIFKEAAKEAGVPLWYTTLAVGHMMYRCPTEDDIRWEINTAVASGVNALFYWFLYSGFYNANYRAAPINELFERTQTFDWVSTENRIFQNVFGTLFTELELDTVYHTETAYGGFPLMDEHSDPLLRRVKATTDVPMLVSRFTRKNDPDMFYYALVLNSTKEPGSVYVDLQRETEVFEVRSTGGEITKRSLGRVSRFQYWFAPGQMWVTAIPKNQKDI